MTGSDERPEADGNLVSTTDVLQELHLAYAYKVNAAVAADCLDDVADLSDAFVAESMAVMAARS